MYMCVCDEEKGERLEGGVRSSENQGVVATGRERCRRKGSQQSLYRFEDRLQSSIVAILRNPNNLSLVRTTDEQPTIGIEIYSRWFYQVAIIVSFLSQGETINFFFINTA